MRRYAFGVILLGRPVLEKIHHYSMFFVDDDLQTHVNYLFFNFSVSQRTAFLLGDPLVFFTLSDNFYLIS